MDTKCTNINEGSPPEDYLSLEGQSSVANAVPAPYAIVSSMEPNAPMEPGGGDDTALPGSSDQSAPVDTISLADQSSVSIQGTYAQDALAITQNAAAAPVPIQYIFQSADGEQHFMINAAEAEDGRYVAAEDMHDTIQQSFLASVKTEEMLTKQQGLESTASLLPDSSLPVDLLQLEDKSGLQKEILIGEVFLNAQATLTQEILEYITLTNEANYLAEVAHKFHLVLQQSTESVTYHGKIDALQKLERHFYQLAFGADTLPFGFESKECQVEEEELCQKVATEDKGVYCDLRRPIFSRSGRQFKLRQEILETDFEDDTEYTEKPSKPAVKNSNIKPSMQHVPEIAPRKRGRPPKKKPKMIHVDEETKKISIPEVMETQEIVPSVLQNVDTMETQQQESQKPEEEQEEHEEDDDDENVEQVETAAIKQEEESQIDKEPPDHSLPSTHQPYVEKYRVSSFQRAKTEAKRTYEDHMPFKYFCDICSFQTKRQSHLDKHKEIHRRKKLPLYHCTQCSFTTMRSGHLSRHQLSHLENVLKCSMCPYKTDNRLHLKGHMRKRHDCEDKTIDEVQVETCRICGYTTDRAHAIKRHMKSHESTEGDGTLVHVFECKQCSYKTGKKMHFTRHMLVVHSERRPFLCDTCGRGFKRADALRQHRVVHMDKSTRKYAYYCNTCSKGFRSPAHLKEHQVIHTNARPFLCDICGASFKTKSVQRKHMITLHSNPRSHVCATCNRSFNTAYTLRRHLKSHDVASASAVTGSLEESDAAAAAASIVAPEVGMVEEAGDQVLQDSDIVLDVGTGEVIQQQQQQTEQNVNTTSLQLDAESLYLHQGSTLQIITQNDMGVEQVQVVMIQGSNTGDNTQVIEAEPETLLYLTGLPTIQ